jgi:hypothetical protein
MHLIMKKKIFLRLKLNVDRAAGFYPCPPTHFVGTDIPLIPSEGVYQLGSGDVIWSSPDRDGFMVTAGGGRTPEHRISMPMHKVIWHNREEVWTWGIYDGSLKGGFVPESEFSRPVIKVIEEEESI